MLFPWLCVALLCICNHRKQQDSKPQIAFAFLICLPLVFFYIRFAAAPINSITLQYFFIQPLKPLFIPLGSSYCFLFGPNGIYKHQKHIRLQYSGGVVGFQLTHMHPKRHHEPKNIIVRRSTVNSEVIQTLLCCLIFHLLHHLSCQSFYAFPVLALMFVPYYVISVISAVRAKSG